MMIILGSWIQELSAERFGLDPERRVTELDRRSGPLQSLVVIA